MTKKNKLKKLLNVFVDADDKTSEGFQAFDEGVSKLKAQLREKIQVNTLDEVNSKFNNFRKRIDFSPLIEAIEQIKEEISVKERKSAENLETQLQELRSLLSSSEKSTTNNKDEINFLDQAIGNLEKQLLEVSSRKLPDFPDFITPIKQTEVKLTKLLESEVKTIRDKDTSYELRKLINDLDATIKQLRIDLVSRINERGGGNMNRQMKIEGVDVLTKYTDVNFIGSSSAITVANDDTNKRVNITFPSGSGGSSTLADVSVASTDATKSIYTMTSTVPVLFKSSDGNNVLLLSETNEQVQIGNGLVGTPSLSFASDTDTGFYRISSNSVGLALGGTAYVTAASSLINLRPVDQVPTQAWLKSSYTTLLGEGVADGGMTGQYDRNELTNMGLRGTVTVTITGAGTFTDTKANMNNFFSGVPGTLFTVSGVDATTTQMIVKVDTGFSQANYSSASWAPFIQTRGVMTTATGSSHTYFNNIVVEYSSDDITYYKPASSLWETTDAKSSQPVPSFWFGSFGFNTLVNYRYVRFTFSDIQIDPGYAFRTSLWFCQLGFRHRSAPYSRQNALTAGDSFFGNVGWNKTAPAQSIDMQSGAIRFSHVTPTTPTTALAGAGAGNLTNGAYLYKVTYVNALGESGTSAASAGTTVVDATTNGQITVTVARAFDPTVTSRKIYRTQSGGSIYNLLTTIADNTTTTYTDNIADATIVSAARDPLVSYSSGALFNGTTRIGTFDSLSRIGFFTATPLVKLDVASSMRLTATASSTLTGTADPTASTTLVGTNTLFSTELVIGDRITVNAETRTVTAIASNTSLTVDTAFTDTAAAAITKLPALQINRLSSNAIGLVQNDLGNVGIGVTAVTAALHLKAGTTAAGTGPIKMTSGSLLTTAEAGVIEFLTDKYYGTITTGAARKELTLNDAALTSGRVPFVTTNGRLTDVSTLTWNGTTLGAPSITNSALTSGRVTFAGTAGVLTDDADMTFATDTLTVTKVVGTSQMSIGTTIDATRLLLVKGDVSGGVATLDRTNASTNAAVGTAIIKGTSTGDMADGFGAAFQFAIQDTAAVENLIADIRGLRDGDDTSGALHFRTKLTGVLSGLMRMNARGDFYYNTNIVTSGLAPLMEFEGGAHTGLTASTEQSDFLFDLARTVQFATGAITSQRAVRVLAPTYGFVGASIITNAATFYITDAPTAGTNATITNAYALWVDAGATRLDGKLALAGVTSPTANLHIAAGTATASTGPIKFTLPGVPLTVPELGVLETDANNLYYTETSLIRKSLSGVIFTQTAGKTVANTITETSIVGTGSGYGLTLPSNFWVVGKTIRITMCGVYSTVVVTGDTVTVKIKYGSTVLSSKATTALVTGGTNLAWEAEVLVTCRSTGSTGTVQVGGGITYQIASAAAVYDEINNGVATSTLNTTTSNLLDVTVTHSAADASNTVTSLVATFEVLN